jgi:hypothetical protein
MDYGVIPPMWPMPDPTISADLGDNFLPSGGGVRNPGLGDFQVRDIPKADPPLYQAAPDESSFGSMPRKADPPIRNDIAYSSGGTFNGRSLQKDIHRQLRGNRAF